MPPSDVVSPTQDGTSQRCRRTEAGFSNRKVTLVFKKDGVAMILVSGSEAIKLPEK
jgi:hypothetical protein